MFPLSNLHSRISAVLLLLFAIVLFLSLLQSSIPSITYSINLFGGILISCIGGYLLLEHFNYKNPQNQFIMLIIIGLVIRLVVAIQPKATIDMANYDIMADSVLNQVNIYETGKVVYTPYWTWFLGILKYTSNVINLPFYFFVRLSLIINDVLIVFLLDRISKLNYLKQGENLKVLSLYFLKPLVIITTVYHPRFGSVVFTFILSAYYIGHNRNNDTANSLLLALGTAVKHISVPALISFFVYSKSNRYRLILPGLVIVFFFLPIVPYYIDNPESIQTSVLRYTSRAGYFGIWGSLSDFNTELYQFMMRFKLLLVLITFTSCLGIVIIAKKKDRNLIEATQLSFLTFHLLTPGWAIQYQFWLIPFGILCLAGKKQLLVFSVIGSLAYTEYFYGDWLINPQIFLPLQYGVIIWWFISIINSNFDKS